MCEKGCGLTFSETKQKPLKTQGFQGFGAAGRIRTADLILTNCSKAPKVLLSSAFGVFLFQRCVAFGAFRSMCSIRTFPRVGHGVGQAENTGRISCRMPVFSSCRFAQVTRVTSSTKWRSFSQNNSGGQTAGKRQIGTLCRPYSLLWAAQNIDPQNIDPQNG